MPSHFKYRIKKTSENKHSTWDYDSVPKDILNSLKDAGVYESSDSNITAGTCAFIHKVKDGSKTRYLCGIRHLAGRADLVASDQKKDGKPQQTQDGSGEGRVSGAKELPPGSFWSDTHFVCKYIDDTSGIAKKEGVANKETILFPMCNCYSPRGGLAITHFDGAVKGSEAPGYPNPGHLPNVYDSWGDGEHANPYTSAPVPGYVTEGAAPKHPYNPTKLGFIFMVLNARATIVPCCWWVGKFPLIYQPQHFRVIDLAVAQETAKGSGGNPVFSSKKGISNIAVYEYREDDYFYPNTGEGYLKNILLGRNYDPTLPNCGNNQRIIYVIDSGLTGKLTKEPADGDDCADIPWHFDSPLWFSPSNCSHPDCKVKYQWGATCNGGGSYDLANGEACPYYENPLIGPESESDKLCTLNKMYPGDSITGGAVLELMWMCKGGFPWTKEEWESVWRVPHIWSTVPFNPGKEWTDLARDEHGNLRRVRGLLIPKYDLYAVKTTVNLNTGKAEQGPPKLLPGGSITHFDRNPGGGLNSGSQLPYFPTTIQELEMRPVGSLNLTWPVGDFSLLNLQVERSEDFIDDLQRLKDTPYSRVIWSDKGKNTLVMGYGSSAKYENGVYCVNLAMLVGKDWKDKKEDLISRLSQFDIISLKTQKLLKDLWRDLLKSQVAGADRILDGMEMQRSFLDSRGTFIFESVPLNLLIEENVILVFGFNSSSSIDATYVRVKPVFNRAYLYQSSAKLMAGWKTTWNGRPSLFVNENDLRDIAGDEYKDTKGKTVDVSLDGSVGASRASGVENLTQMLSRAEALAADLKKLNEEYGNLVDAQTKEHYAKQIESKGQAYSDVMVDIQLAIAESAAVSSIITNAAEERSKIEAQIEELEDDIKTLKKHKSSASSSGNPTLSEFYSGLIAELNYNIGTLESQLELLPEEREETEDSEEETDPWEPWEAVDIDRDAGEKDTDEGGSLDGDENTTISEDDDDAIQPGEGNIDRLYIPYLNPLRKNQKAISKYTSILPGGASQPKPKLEILKDSGIASWKYFDIGWEGNSAEMEPYWVYAPKGAKRVVVYSTRELSGGGSGDLKGVSVGEELGRWYTLASCSSMIVLIVNPEVANLHNEFMIYSMSAEINYEWKGADGSMETATRKIKFVPFNYSQVERDFPGYVAGKTAEEIGTINKHGVSYKKISVSENVEIVERPEGNRHPWVIFAIACTENSDVKPWPEYNGQWEPTGDLEFTTLPNKTEKVDLYMEYAYIGEVYDQDDRRFKTWSEGANDEGEYRTRILFNHPRAGTVRSVFKIGDGEIGEGSSDGMGIADGFKAVPIGSSAATAIWPYARLACRDYEIHYIWRDNMRNGQVTDRFFMGKDEPRECIGPSKRYTYYTHGDHDLGNVFTPKITFGHWEGRGDERTWNEEDIGYSWNTGRQTEEGDPTSSFPEEAGKSYGPGNAEGPLYYPYTRAEPHSKYVPVHPVYIWDFMLTYRNKPKKKKYFGGFRMWASDICYIGPTEQRSSQWETYFEYNPDEGTVWMGRSRTRGPLFQLEYEDYEEKKPKIIFLRPFASRNKDTTNVTWTYYASVKTTKDEEWDPDQLEDTKSDPTPKADNPDSLTKGVWKAICRGLYASWSNGDESAYYDLEEQANWGADKGWEVSYTDGLRFPDEEEYEPPSPPNNTNAYVQYLDERIQFYTDHIKYLEQEKDKAESVLDKSQIEEKIERYQAILDKLKDDMFRAKSDPTYVDEDEEEESDEDLPDIPGEKEELDVDLLTGCHKRTLEEVDQRGSFFFDNTYMPSSVSEKWQKSMESEADSIKEDMKKSSSRFYWYEQKSFGTNLPWSPYDSPPLFGNTGREMYIVELCTLGSIISWLPTTDEENVDRTVGKENVPSWWTAREPEGDPIELVTMIAPEPECTRAVKTLSSEPQNPFYSYIFPKAPFKETKPDYETAYSPHEVRIVTKHDPDHYGESWYRSDVGRLTLTLTESEDEDTSKLTKIKVYGDSPATKDSEYQSVTTPSIIEGVPNSATPEPGDESQDSELPPNALWGRDIKGLAVESGQTVFVGQRYPGYYSPYTHGKVFVGYKDVNFQQVHWAWPKDNRDRLSRGESLVKMWTELPDLNSKDKNQPIIEAFDGLRVETISYLQCAPYVQKHPTADDGREVSLGPDLKRDSQKSGEREIIYKPETFYAIVVESERDQGGKTRPPLIWAQQIDNPDLAKNPDYFKRPRGHAVAYRVLQDGTISAVTIGKEQTYDTPFSTGFLFPKTIRNSAPGGNFITSDVMNAAGKYPAFDIGSIAYRYIGKVFSHKDYTASDLSKKGLVVKNKNAYGYNNHTVKSSLLLPNLGADILFVEISYKSYFFNGIEQLFINRSDGAAISVTIEGTPVAGTDYLGDSYHKSFVVDLPLLEGVDVKDNKVIYDLDFGLAKNCTLSFTWNVRCNSDEFDKGIWGGPDREYNYDTKQWETNESNVKHLSDLIDKITLGVMLPGKCVEVVKLEEAKFVVSTGERSKLAGERHRDSYNFFEKSNKEWYKCTWKENDEYLEREWDQENLFLDHTAKKGEKQTDEWAQDGYEQSVDSFREAGLNYNKFPKSDIFENSCVEIPELPQSKLKMQAWEDNVGEDNDGRDWTWGGIWTTRVAGPEWRTSDPLPSRDFIWWPAPPYYPGRLIFKGRAWFFGAQYKDEAKVMHEGKDEDNKRQIDEEDEFNKDAYTNMLTGYDKLMRNIQDFEAYRSNVRKGQSMTKQSKDKKIQDRKQAAAQASLNRMWGAASAGVPGMGMIGPPFFPPTRNFVVNTYKAFNFLDEVGLRPEDANWDTVKQLEEDKQKKLYEEAIKLGEDNLGDEESITATAIIPYYEWQSLIDLTEKDWYDRNGGGDFSPLTAEILESKKDEACVFTWKNWDWEYVQSFTFRDEHKYKYEPSANISQSVKGGLLRRCGRKWKILGEAKAKKHPLEEAQDSLEDAKSAIEAEQANIQDQDTLDDIDDVLDKITEGKQFFSDVYDYLDELGGELWEHYNNSMGTSRGTSILPKGYSQHRDQNLLDHMKECIDYARCDEECNLAGRIGTNDQESWLTLINTYLSEIGEVRLSSKKINKSLLESTEAIELVKLYIENLIPAIEQCKQKMEYFNNVTEDLLVYTRALLVELGWSLREGETRIDKIDCHGPEDDDKKGHCDEKNEEYKQKWEWDPNRDTSSDWPSDVSEDGGSTVKRPDPWWRY